jgi:hypothetical protein
MTDETVFLTVVETASLPAARLMIASLRAFGGALADAPLWVFSPEPERLPGLAGPATRLLPLEPLPDTPCLFAEKVAACARAEALLPSGTRSLVWIDPGCLVIQPPLLFCLGPDCQAAVRPVHIRNVGLPPGEPLDVFWGTICAAVSLEDIPGTVTSFVDGQVLRSYFNSHAFAVDPALGLMREWHTLFLRLVGDPAFVGTACADPLHQTFLFQALLSALLVRSIPADRLRLLPPAYNYPGHLQERVPAARRVPTLNDLVCCTYEDLDPAGLPGFTVHEPLTSWIEHQTHKESS